jgi:3-hydroxyisobutyrate dehydrogenase-like beta-hydroxyacid dehydrogenase
MQISFIGFGEAARAFTETLSSAGGGHAISAFDRLDTPDMAAEMSSRGVRRAATPADAVAGADWVISAVTADQSYKAAQSVLNALASGQVFIDINSVSPRRKALTAEAVEARGAQYLDMAVMAPVHPLGHATPVLLAGRADGSLVESLLGAGFVIDLVGERAGEATAVKMVRSVFVKGLEAITVECALAAAAAGVHDRVFTSLVRSYPNIDWPVHIAHSFERTLRHGTRRAAEMRESAATLDEMGLIGGLAMQIADIQARMGALPLINLPDGDVPAAVKQVAEACGAKARE